MKTKTYKEFIKESVEEAKINEASFNIAAEPSMFGDMIKGIIEKKPKRKYLVINGFDGEELYGTISDKPIKESEEVNEAKTVSYDDAFAELTDNETHDYEVSYKSHTDIQEFIDFLRSYYPKGTKFV